MKGIGLHLALFVATCASTWFAGGPVFIYHVVEKTR